MDISLIWEDRAHDAWNVEAWNVEPLLYGALLRSRLCSPTCPMKYYVKAFTKSVVLSVCAWMTLVELLSAGRLDR